MQGEIGGYLELEHFAGAEYYPDAIRLSSARNALLYILLARKIDKIYIPYFLCDAVSNLLKREGIRHSFYHVGEDLRPDPSFQPEGDGPVYVVNYYGQLSNEEVLALKERFGSVIVDNVQAFFQPPAQGIDTVYSCRKFFGVPDGGYAATDARLPQQLLRETATPRMDFLLGRFESGSASSYYSSFLRSEEQHDEAPLLAMSSFTQNVLRAVDYNRVRMLRERNYAALESALREANRLRLDPAAGPYAYPFYTENGPILRKQLASEGIYIPTLWPNVQEIGDKTERRLAENILPLPCDQRYTPEQMRYVSERLLLRIDSLKQG